MTTLSVLNIKGVTGQFNLTPITVIGRDNSKGKTALLSAIRLALMGYDPTLGKRHIDTFNLASGESMAVIADGKAFRWEQKRAKVQATLPEGFEPAPSTMLDLGSLFAATKEQRMLTIMKACVMPADINTKTMVDEVRVVAPKFPFPKATETVLEDVEALSAACKAYISTISTGIDEIDGAAKNHADNMASLPPEPVSLEPQITSMSQQVGVAKEKLKAAKNSDGSRAQLEAKLKAMVVPEEEKLREEIAAVEGALIGLPAGEITEVNAKYDGEIKKLQEQVGNKRGQYTAIKARLDAVKGKEECPTCGHAITGADLAGFEKKLEKLKDDGQKLATKLKALETDRDQERTQIIGATNKRTDATKRVAVLKQRIDTIPELTAHRQMILDQIATIPGTDQITQFQNEVDGLNAAIEALQQRQRNHIAARKLQASADAAVKVRQGKEDELGQAKTAKSLIDAFRVKIIDRVSETVLAVANRVVEPTTGHRLEMVDGDFVLGKAVLTTLSGSERMLVYAGLQIALSASHQPKIVLMDELGQIDQTRKAKLFAVIEQLIGDGTISQFVGADTYPLTSLPTVCGASLIIL
jgi:hypothetical protein